MEEDRKNLYFGWMASSALITVLLFALVPQLSSGGDLGYIMIIALIIYSTVLFVWALPFIALRNMLGELLERRKDRRPAH